MREIHMKVISYDDIPSSLGNQYAFLEEAGYTSFVQHTIGVDTLSQWILETYPEVVMGENVLIEIDY